jgi:hypothetical protein
MHYFFKHNGVWRYKRPGALSGSVVDTFALERVLGVMGGPEVIVVRKQPNGSVYHINVKNGFIDKVERAGETVGALADGTEYIEVTEFHAKEITL